MNAIVNSSGGNELAWELQLQNLELSIRPSKGKVRTIKVAWGNHCSIFLDNPQGLSGSIIEVRINLKEQCQCTNYNTMCGVSYFNTLLFLTELMIIKAHFFWLVLDFIYDSALHCFQKLTKSKEIFQHETSFMICIEILFLLFLWRKWPHLDNMLFLEAATTYIAGGFTKFSTCPLSSL